MRAVLLGRLEPPIKIMKTIHKILLATAAAACFSMVNRVSAADVFLTPRAMGNQIKTVSGVNNDPDLLQTYNPIGTSKIAEQMAALYPPQISNSSRDPDLLSRYAELTGSPKDKQLSTQA